MVYTTYVHNTSVYDTYTYSTHIHITIELYTYIYIYYVSQSVSLCAEVSFLGACLRAGNHNSTHFPPSKCRATRI